MIPWGNELSQGSGFIISKDGDVITCYHVMRGYSKAVVNTSDKKEFQVTNITAINKSNDLIRLSISATEHDFNFLKLNTTIPEVGQEIIVIGGPLGLENTVSQGIVSAIRDNETQITAPISPGSSGGPVLNMNGEVIGIVAAQMKVGQNLNFAIPSYLISTMKPASAEQIKEIMQPVELVSAKLKPPITQGMHITVGKIGSNYTNIWEAIDAANPGDTIEVQSGTYYESIIIDKRLTLRGIDTGKGLPVIDGSAKRDTVTLNADRIVLENFIITNSGNSFGNDAGSAIE